VGPNTGIRSCSGMVPARIKWLGGCVPGHRSGWRARTARNTSTWPQTARQPLSGPRRPLRTATAPEIGLLAKATAQLPSQPIDSIILIALACFLGDRLPPLDPFLA